MVYIGATDGKLYAFNAQGCGQPTCQPIWTAQTGSSISGSSATIVNGLLYVAAFDQDLYVFNAQGCGQPTCSPLWVGATGEFIESSPAVANGVVYLGGGEHTFYTPSTRMGVAARSANPCGEGRRWVHRRRWCRRPPSPTAWCMSVKTTA